MIDSILKTMDENVKDWHSRNLTWFSLSFKDSVEELGAKIIFHNYCIWHFIEGYQDPDTLKVHFVYSGGLEHNKARNQAIEMIDDKFIEIQKGTGKINSETLGSVIDRISVMYIKILHLENDSRISKIKKQTEILEHCARELLEDMLSGERRIENLSRFKTSGYENLHSQ